MAKSKDTENLTSIPGIGKSLAEDLKKIGIEHTSDLKNKYPEKLYALASRHMGHRQDPCVLYAFRCAVYYANGGRETAKLLWWNWKE